jgi:muconolactone delta-isomerase
MSRGLHLVNIAERECDDAQEQAAMLRFRALAIDYRWELEQEGKIEFAFYFRDKSSGLFVIDVESNEQIDFIIKRDPLFPYAHITVTPLIDTAWLINEAQDFLGEQMVTPERAKELVHPRRAVDPTRSYVFVHKEVRPFSPLLSEEEQDEIFRRTVRSQDAHENLDLEFADFNPVGQQIGLLIGCGTEEDVMNHVRNCEVFPDTVVTCEHLLVPALAFDQCQKHLVQLRRVPPSSRFFNQTVR